MVSTTLTSAKRFSASIILLACSSGPITGHASPLLTNIYLATNYSIPTADGSTARNNGDASLSAGGGLTLTFNGFYLDGQLFGPPLIGDNYDDGASFSDKSQILLEGGYARQLSRSAGVVAGFEYQDNLAFEHNDADLFLSGLYRLTEGFTIHASYLFATMEGKDDYVRVGLKYLIPSREIDLGIQYQSESYQALGPELEISAGMAFWGRWYASALYVSNMDNSDLNHLDIELRLLF